jgi:serine protease Do
LPTAASNDKRHSPKYIAGLSLAAAAILVVGFLLKPRKPTSEAPPPLSQTEMQRLARMAERRALDTMTGHFSEVAGGLASRVVQVGAGTGSGILWDPRLVLTAGRGMHAPESTVVLTPAGHLLTGTRVAGGPQLPLAAYELPGETPLSTDSIEEAAGLGPAEWILSVWQQEGDLAFVPGHYLETRLATCDEVAVEEVVSSVALSTEMAGGGLFDLDGALVAVILPCGEGYAALSPDSVSMLVERGRGLDGQMLALYGLRAVSLSEATGAHLGVEQGALVSETWTGHLAAEAGLRPGDVIVGLGEHEVGSPKDLQPLLLPPELGMRLVRARRGRRTVEVDLSADFGSPTALEDGDRGVRLASAPAGFPIGSVFPGSRADEAGLRTGDRIVRVDGVEPRTAAELRRVLARRRAAFVEVERGGRRLGLLLE